MGCKTEKNNERVEFVMLIVCNAGFSQPLGGLVAEQKTYWALHEQRECNINVASAKTK